MPQKPAGAVHEMPVLVHQMSTESKPFLNDLQRQALDAALAAKLSKLSTSEPDKVSLTRKASRRMSVDGREAPALSKSEVTQDKKSRNGRNYRSSKKDGAGGKYTWGAVMDSGASGPALDPRDPNYDSGDDGSPVQYSLESAASGQPPLDSLAGFKRLVADVLNEYFLSGDIDEVAHQLQEATSPHFEWAFVKKAVTAAMDHHEHEREMTSLLLSSLYDEVILPEQMRKGFTAVFEALEDLQLDVPDVATMAATFVARAVIDDILPPSFVSKLPAGTGNTAAAKAKANAEAQLKARHAGERAGRCWGARPGLSQSEATRAAITQLLQEYAASGDVHEARQRLRDLSTPFFHHEVVKQALVMAMQEPKLRSSLMALLQQLVASADIPSSQLTKGFQRVADNLEDISLDNPQATTAFPSIVSDAQAEGWLDSSFQAGASTCSNGSGIGVVAYKSAAAATTDEYFASGEVGEVVRRLAELDEPALANMFVKQLVIRAMERKARECEAASVLLSALHPKLIDPQQAALGFTRLLAAAEDASLDTPAAPHLLALFLGRAVVDEVLPPAYLVSVLPALPDASLGVTVVHAAGAMLKARHAAERLQGAWHGGLSTIDQLRDSMHTTLAEFVVSRDEDEAARSLAELSTPHYHHEFVKRALVAAFENPAAESALLSLLAHLADSNQVTQTQMRKGFQRVKQDLDDINLDCPNAPQAFTSCQKQAEADGWLQTDQHASKAA